tara:strand:- start:19470 stop:19877 length:408 start_codon:yes stop_codon:yes gene_type:complete
MPNLTPRRVRKQVGVNPIAQAVARDIMRKSIVDQKIQLYLTQEGESCVEFCAPLRTLFQVLVSAATLDPKVKSDSYEVRIIRGTISAIDQMIADNSYRRINTVSLETGLDCAYELVGKVNSELFNREWNRLAGGV